MTRLHLLYTAHLNGALERLPRLYTFLKHLRHQAQAEQTLLLDLGGSCSPDSWHCAATNRRRHAHDRRQHGGGRRRRRG